MKLKHRCLILAVLCLLPSLQTWADSPVTFEVVATYDYPGFTDVFASKINDDGYIGGSVDDQMGHAYGYIRSPAGHLSQLITVPNSHHDNFTLLYGINNLRQTCGVYDGGPYPDGGFLLSHQTFIDADFPGAVYTQLYGLNDAGNFCGTHSTGGDYSGFINTGGTYISFTVPGTTVTGAFGINNLDQCAGYYYTDTEEHGFRRDADGTMTYPIDAPGFEFTGLYGINDHGWMVGAGGNSTGTTHSFLFRSLSRVATYDYPGASGGTVFLGINNNGLICGYYVDDQGTHGLVVKPVAAE